VENRKSCFVFKFKLLYKEFIEINTFFLLLYSPWYHNHARGQFTKSDFILMVPRHSKLCSKAQLLSLYREIKLPRSTHQMQSLPCHSIITINASKPLKANKNNSYRWSRQESPNMAIHRGCRKGEKVQSKWGRKENLSLHQHNMCNKVAS
jgi:hypothetical protein